MDILLAEERVAETSQAGYPQSLVFEQHFGN
jgi:hypothetical protein